MKSSTCQCRVWKHLQVAACEGFESQSQLGSRWCLCVVLAPLLFLTRSTKFSLRHSESYTSGDAILFLRPQCKCNRTAPDRKLTATDPTGSPQCKPQGNRNETLMQPRLHPGYNPQRRPALSESRTPTHTEHSHAEISLCFRDLCPESIADKDRV